MSEASRTDASDLARQALVQIRDLRARLAEAEAARSEPIAIVGTGMRLPGGIRNLDSLSIALAGGLDAITDIPADRWDSTALFDPNPDAPGRMITRRGAFIDEIDRFDAEFFGISPHEAARMDPQQRMLLEVGWEAIEDAAIATAALDGRSVGVFLGISNGDYGRAMLAHPEQLDIYASTGNAYSVAAGRLAYFLGLKGPSIAIDTACSSSLVALHLACQSLRQRECELALAGGVNLILTPEMNIIFSHGRMMAADGRCKTFDASADGYVRGEGCGLLVLRRLSDAVASRARILGIVRGSAVNQDGRSGGLTAPSGPAQVAVINAALRSGGVAAKDVSYVEAHGTGTPLGDPIEIGAIAQTLCADRAEPLLVGSIKTNVGHLEAAAGVAGVFKVLAAMGARRIPPNLHFYEGNPHIDWSQPIVVPTVPTVWEPASGRRLAGVSSFGFAGCNAHVVIEEPPLAGEPVTALARSADLICLSARDPSALGDLAENMLDRLSAASAIDLANISFTAHVGRSAFGYRLAVRGAGAPDIHDKVKSFLDGRSKEGVVTGRAGANQPKVAFLFPGQGAQHAGMGRELYETCAVFRETLDECGRILSPLMGLDFVSAALSVGTDIDDVRVAQPATFAIQWALAKMWRAWGIEPALVVGHSLGEYSAACVAGIIPVEQALTLVAERSRLTAALALPGAMGAIFAPPDEVAPSIAASSGLVSIAAYNGPDHVVISGERKAVTGILADFEARGRRVRPLRVDHAAHSAQIEPVLPRYRTRLESMTFASGVIPFVSSVTGSIAAGGSIDAQYWCDHMRQPVRFAEGARIAAAQGITHWIEIGPHPVLLPMVQNCVGGDETKLLPSMRRDRSAWSVVSDSVAQLYVDGSEISWETFHEGQDGQRVPLPTYPFRRRRHWADALSRPASRTDFADEWRELCTAMDRQAGQGPLDLNLASYPAKWDLLARLTRAHAVRTLRECGIFASTHESRTVDEVLAVGGISPIYGRLVARWLRALVHDGVLVRRGDVFMATAPLPEPDLAALWQEASMLFADNRPLLNYVAQCGDLLGRVLRGKESPLETLFPQGSVEIAQALYEQSATMRYVNALAATAMQTVSRTAPAGTLRVMEVGAGTGSTTTSLLDVLGPAAHYAFTDISTAFLDRARERFGGRRRMAFALFDLDKEPATQGCEPASVDVIVAANALHASTDLRTALRHLHGLLAPGGCLVLIESTIHFEWFDMSTGLIGGWQNFADDLRVDHPLLGVAAWQSALAAAGFAQSRAWPQAGTPAEVLGQHVIVARVAGERAAGRTAHDDIQPMALPSFAPAETSSDMLDRLQETYPAERRELLREFVRNSVMRVLGSPSDAPPDRHARLMDLGLDSLMAVQLRGLLARGMGAGINLPASIVFDHPTIESIVEFLLAHVVAAETIPSAAPPQEEAVSVLTPRSKRPVPTDAEIEAILMERLPHG